MAAPRFSTADLASSILASVDRELNKTAAPTYISDRAKTDIGKDLSKLAQAVREYEPEALTWDDVAEYRRRHGR